MYWNCYIDKPISTRYLYCTIKTKDGLLTGEFSIDTKDLTSREAFIVENTMNNKGQNVLNQYNKQVGNEIGELVKRISDRIREGDSFEEIIQNY